MKKVFVLSIILICFFSFNVYANDFIFNRGNSESITIISDKATIKGITLPNVIIKLNNNQTTSDNTGYFEFNDLDKGSYDLRILNEQGKEVYNEIIKINNNENVNLGNINIGNDSIDVSEEKSQIDFKKIKEKRNEKSNFFIDNLSFEHKVSFLDINYNKNLSIGDDYRSTYSTKGILNETTIKLPFSYNNHTLALGMDYGKISSDNAEEFEYNNGYLDNIYMVSYESDYVNLKASYYYDMQNLGRIKGFVGTNYYSNDFDNSRFTSTNSPDHFGKNYFEGDGFIYGFSFDTYINKYMNLGNNNLFNNMLLGFEYMKSQDDVKVSSTNEFSSFTTTGYRDIFDFYIGYRNKYDVKVGYKYIKNYVDEYVEKTFYYPSLDMEMKGFYFSVGIEF